MGIMCFSLLYEYETFQKTGFLKLFHHSGDSLWNEYSTHCTITRNPFRSKNKNCEQKIVSECPILNLANF